MIVKKAIPKTIDEYVASFPKDIQAILEKIRMTIKQAAPDAEETIKYGMPTFTLKGNLVFFAAFKRHIGFYPPTTGNEQLNHALAAYQGPKDSLKFPLDKPMPYDLISEIVTARVKENLQTAEARGKKKKWNATNSNVLLKKYL